MTVSRSICIEDLLVVVSPKGYTYPPWDATLRLHEAP
jgi:hypothetical protein